MIYSPIALASYDKSNPNSPWPTIKNSANHPVLIDSFNLAIPTNAGLGGLVDLFVGRVRAASLSLARNLIAQDGWAPRDLLPVMDGAEPVLLNALRFNYFDPATLVETPLGGMPVPWMLPKPLFLPPGGEVQFRPAISGIDFIEPPRVVALGRALPASFPIPKEIAVPILMAALLIGKDKHTGSPTVFRSDQTQFRNWAKWPMIIREIVGQQRTGADTLEGFPQARSSYRIFDSRGAIIMRDPTPRSSWVNPAHRAWPIHTTLAPGQYMIVEQTIGTGGGAGGTIGVAMNGHMMVPFDEVGFPAVR